MTLDDQIRTAVRAAAIVRTVTIGPGYFDPVFPYHGALRPCPFCGDLYRVHGGFSDHRDECSAGPCPGANPVPIEEVDP